MRNRVRSVCRSDLDHKKSPQCQTGFGQHAQAAVLTGAYPKRRRISLTCAPDPTQIVRTISSRFAGMSGQQTQLVLHAIKTESPLIEAGARASTTPVRARNMT